MRRAMAFFGAAYEVMLRNDPHAPRSIDHDSCAGWSVWIQSPMICFMRSCRSVPIWKATICTAWRRH